jgi:hypothetical protein
VAHDQIYFKIIEALYGGATEGEAKDENIVAINWSTYRQLCHLAVNPISVQDQDLQIIYEGSESTSPS